MSSGEEEALVRESYERLPYPAALDYFTHPDHLAVLGLLQGIETASPARCRVLELGCADGGNIIPMALELPESRFLGIDLAPSQIEKGDAFARALGLTNVDLRAMSILDADESLGTFDFIICHGVFSWVREEVQEKILALCASLLAPEGIAYVSYNTYPAWHMREAIREMVLYHTANATDEQDRIDRAYALVRFLADSTAGEEEAWAKFLRSTREHFEEYADRPAYLMHDYCERTNAPVYVHQFMARAAHHALQYAGDAEPPMNEPDNLGPVVASSLRAFASDALALEQYVDFTVNRAFRRTLLCRGGATLDRTMRVERMRRLFAATSTKPVSAQPDLRGAVPEAFKTERGKDFTSDHPAAKSVLVALAEVSPAAMSFETLVQRAGVSEEVVADILWSLYWSGIGELHLVPPQCTNAITAKPRASELVRRQVAVGPYVTSLRRRVLKLDDPIARFLLRQLDGTRDRAALLRLLDAEVSAGRLDITAGDQRVTAGRIPMVLQAVLDHNLRRMAGLALLTS